MLTRQYAAAMHVSNEQGEYCGSGSADRLELRYKLSTLHFTFLTFFQGPCLTCCDRR